jgi:hypothetical protein
MFLIFDLHHFLVAAQFWMMQLLRDNRPHQVSVYLRSRELFPNNVTFLAVREVVNSSQ